MIRRAISFCLILFNISFAFADAVKTEKLYDQYLNSLDNYTAMTSALSATVEDKKILTDAIWDAIIVGERTDIQKSLRFMDISTFHPADQIRLEILKAHPEKARLSSHLEKVLQSGIDRGQLDNRTRTTLAVYSDSIVQEDFLFQHFALPRYRKKTKSEIKDLFFNSPDLGEYANGRYKNGIRIFMFCRRQRIYKCRILMKDKNGNVVMNESGNEIWSQPALGLSRLRLSYHQRNGYTPSGVYTMDSVMPHANKQRIYGSFRRVILNFIPASENESSHKAFLPSSAHNKEWWREAVVARDVGRNLLRIHGTGIIRTTSRDPFHPLRPTLGCVMQREKRVGGVNYKDQRRLLDTAMNALGLEVKFENETRFNGALYVIELDDKRRAVTDTDLKEILDL